MRLIKPLIKLIVAIFIATVLMLLPQFLMGMASRNGV